MHPEGRCPFGEQVRPLAAQAPRARAGEHEPGLAFLDEATNVGGETERRNNDFVHRLCEIVTDCPGHGQRCAIDCSKLKGDLGWSKAHGFDEGLRNTMRWHLKHHDCVESVRTGEYRKWIQANYSELGRT